MIGTRHPLQLALVAGFTVFGGAACSAELGDSSRSSKDADSEVIHSGGQTVNEVNAGGGSTPGSGGEGSVPDAGGSGGMPLPGTTGGSGGTTPGSGGASETGAGGQTTSPPPPCKRGLAYGNHSKADFATISPAISWWYNWSSRPDPELRDGTYLAAGVDYAPMIWGGNFNVNDLIDDIPADAEVLLGFNEPNFGEQSNLSAAEAAALWPSVEQVADTRGLKLVSPAVNYCGGDCQDTNPFDYLDDFFAACPGCRVDALGVHVYVGCDPGGDNKAQWLINIIEQYKERFSQPLWLTEFACTDAASFAEQTAFMLDALEYLDNEPRVERYAWFSGRFAGIPNLNLLAGDGQLTPLGQAYVSADSGGACSN